MILTGREIEREWRNGRITIDPFFPEQVNPNSYNFRLGRTLRVYRPGCLDPRQVNEFDEIEIPDEGYVLEPGRLFLAHTIEILGSDHYAPTFAARSSIARLGIFINLSASLGDIGYKGQWTLQLYTSHSVRVYAGINIGQMMWWRTQGEIQLYEGKYQGASGPRSSDIHVDFEKQFARDRFPGLGATLVPGSVGPKFAALAEASSRFRVPPAFCVPEQVFDDAIDTGLLEQLAEAFEDLRATVGAFFAESVARIAELAEQITFPECERNLLVARLREVFDESDVLAVRSSGIREDTATSSLAGVHDTVLGVRGPDEVVAAVEQCWRSYYAAPAVAARVRDGDFEALPRLAVIVQEQIDPVIAGIAFTGLAAGERERTTIEYVTGLADRLVAGVAAPTTVDSSDLGTEHLVELSAVVELAGLLKEQHGHDVDIEWAADESGVWLIQIRPLTATLDRAEVKEPVGAACSLYFDQVPASFELGDVAAVYSGYVAKRGPAYRLAAANGVAVGAGWVLHFNGRGLHDEETAARLRAELATGSSGECVLDLGDNLRQIVVAKEDVLARLAELTGAGPDGTALRAAVVRDYIRGELGVIVREADHGVVVEYSSAGLMALNRGTAGGQTLVMSASGEVDTPTAHEDAVGLLPHLGQLKDFAAAMRAKYGSVTIECVYADDRIYFVDYSILGDDPMVVTSSGGVRISPGTAVGRLYPLDQDELLSRLSIGPAVSISKSADLSEYAGLATIVEKIKALEEKPIIHASRPYAVLSVLIGHVAGFVFEQGSTLGHLAILLREAGVPAVAATGVRTAEEVVISDGMVTVNGERQGR
ncbi:PEP/pyruvate-binding domain-containing protein [Amycolatopsis sp. NPDC059657]|uniref:PEP/pyruvate-binding domain-containing protein n=1 Tax=Amycolatopsis sp. NPDC059657 TaxID=3346899 RepID=UPI00366ED2CD